MINQVKCPHCDQSLPIPVTRTTLLLAESLKHIDLDNIESVKIIVGLIKKIETMQDDQQS